MVHLIAVIIKKVCHDQPKNWNKPYGVLFDLVMFTTYTGMARWNKEFFYWLGFRIVEEKWFRSWKDVYDLPLKEVLERSGHKEYIDALKSGYFPSIVLVNIKFLFHKRKKINFLPVLITSLRIF